MENGQGRGVNRISEPSRVVFIDFQPIAVFVFYGSFMVVDDPCLFTPEKKNVVNVEELRFRNYLRHYDYMLALKFLNTAQF